jgi:hypothetical protein
MTPHHGSAERNSMTVSRALLPSGDQRLMQALVKHAREEIVTRTAPANN